MLQLPLAERKRKALKRTWMCKQKPVQILKVVSCQTN